MKTSDKARNEKEGMPHFNTPIGEFIGKYDGNIIRLYGIPYAKARRFQKPVPIVNLQSPFIADKPCPACPQHTDDCYEGLLGSNSIGHLRQEEECLNLSIARPGNLEAVNLPVMVWVHGGGYISGAGDATVFDPQFIVQEQQVIVVSLNYRLGIFGFLGDYNHRAANLGLFDLMEALRWINKNIEFFGGNSENITLFGQSAGGDAIAHLMIAEGTQGLFQKAIIQSAPLGISMGKAPMTEKMKLAAMQMKEESTTEEIMETQKQVLQAAQGFGLKSGMPFGVQYGQAPLPKESDSKNIWEKRAQEYDILIGYTLDETTLFVPAMKNLDRFWKLPLIGKLLRTLFIKMTTRKVYAKSAYSFAKQHTKGRGNAYFYKIKFGSKQNGLGATHTIDLPLLFGNEHIWKNAELIQGISWEELYRYGKDVRKLWADFARTGLLDRKGGIGHVLTYKRVR